MKKNPYLENSVNISAEKKLIHLYIEILNLYEEIIFQTCKCKIFV